MFWPYLLSYYSLFLWYILLVGASAGYYIGVKDYIIKNRYEILLSIFSTPLFIELKPYVIFLWNMDWGIIEEGMEDKLYYIAIPIIMNLFFNRIRALHAQRTGAEEKYIEEYISRKLKQYSLDEETIKKYKKTA